MRKGFTLMELLVASLLLGMLVTILAQVFSQSSIAWSAGTAGVVELDNARRDMAELQLKADNLLGGGRSVCSVFDGMDGQKFSSRAYSETSDDIDIANPASWTGKSVGGAGDADARGVVTDGRGYAVGVRSAGPDKQFGTWDDITTWPFDGEGD